MVNLLPYFWALKKKRSNLRLNKENKNIKNRIIYG